MLHELNSNILKNEYTPREPDENSRIICLQGRSMLIKALSDNIMFPVLSDLADNRSELTYLFSIGEKAYFYSRSSEMKDQDRFTFCDVSRQLRYMQGKEEVFAAFTSFHLVQWYESNRFCGRCGSATRNSVKERMLYCPECHNEIYPRISPAVIVAVTDKNRLLMTRYAGRDYKRFALVAGYTEIGETLEQTAAREVMEETGLKIKNIRYYKNQPWGLTGTELVGFFAELDGSPEITLDTTELAEAGWYLPEQIDVRYEDMSLTNEMICFFKNRK